MLEVYIPQSSNKLFPFVSFPVPCGEPLENENTIEWLSLDDYVSQSSDSLLYVRVRGESMIDVGIETGDLVVVDRLRKPEIGSIVLARLGNRYTIKKFKEINTRKKRHLFLVPANGKLKPREIKEDDDFEIIGVMTFSVKRYC